MNRIDRLFAITLLLQSKSRVRAADLATTFGVSERTIYRDMTALSEIGVPIASLPGEGYELMEGFHLPPVLLSVEEASALFLSGQMLMKQATGNIVRDIQLALEKITAALPADTCSQVEALGGVIDFLTFHGRFSLDDPQLLHIQTAILDKRLLRLQYQGYRTDDLTEREVEPESLKFIDGAWYLNGFCRLRNDNRTFRLNRIDRLDVLDETFTPRMMFPQRQDIIRVEVRFKAEVIRHVHERQHYSFHHAQSDNVLIYHIHDLSEISGWILGWGTDAEVVSPVKLRHAIRDEAKRLIELLT